METFERLHYKTKNPITAVLTGKAKIKGQMAAAAKLKDILG